ncbi:MAG TPA: sulfite exporter TauE/SafE family protein, partial [Saprospiraceae bacterium]|nr:sulfite exporter TauE/SafE family protein [Saprospiraceae bacterium]
AGISYFQIKSTGLTRIRLWHIGLAIFTLKIVLITYFLITILPTMEWSTVHFSNTFFLFVVVGFIAQMIDGTLGMAYGVSCTTLLLNFGVPPKVASAAVHTAEVFTTGVSGLSHIRFKNIDKRLFFRLVFPGVIGAMTGAFFLSNVFNGAMVKPYVSAYLLILGFVILYKGIRNKPKDHQGVRHAELLALIGGFMDSVGGGGWGPIVTSNIINQGKNPKETIGTVNTTEFFVAFFSTGVFLFFVGVSSWPVVLGLILGGILAAPLGAFFASRVNKKTLMILVGIVIILTSSYTILKALFF